jgi:hypothetical protein
MYGGGPYDVAHESAPAPPSPKAAQAAGHLLQDLTEGNLVNEASDLLGVRHLDDCSGPTSWPAEGKLFGIAKRPLVCLPTALPRRSDYKQVIYLVDTGAPITELSPHALQALGCTDNIPSATTVNINGQLHPVYLCSPAGNHADIPVLGADVMAFMGLELRVNYKTHSVSLSPAV